MLKKVLTTDQFSAIISYKINQGKKTREVRTMTINKEHNNFRIEICFKGKLLFTRYEKTWEEAFHCYVEFDRRGFDPCIFEA